MNVNAAWVEMQKTSKRTGATKTKYRIDVTSDDLVVDLSEREMVAEYAALVRELVQKQFYGVTALASDATIKRRKRAAANTDSAWYRRRYKGGRTGESKPNKTSRLFNDSNRMADNLSVRLRKRSTGQSAATINVVANRLDKDRFGDAADFEAMVALMRKHVPLLGGKVTGDAAKKMKTGAKKLADQALHNSMQKYKALKRQRMRALVSLLRAVGSGL